MADINAAMLPTVAQAKSQMKGCARKICPAGKRGISGTQEFQTDKAGYGCAMEAIGRRCQGVKSSNVCQSERGRRWIKPLMLSIPANKRRSRKHQHRHRFQSRLQPQLQSGRSHQHPARPLMWIEHPIYKAAGLLPIWYERWKHCLAPGSGPGLG